MNIITRSLVKNFLDTNEINSVSESVDFERFVTYSIANKHYISGVDLEDVITGNGNDIGLDSIIIIVNGVAINSKEDIEELKETNKYLEVTFIIIQAKTTQKFETQEINTYVLGIQDYFLSSIGLKRNNLIEQKKKLFECIMDNAHLLRENPKCFLYYVTTGTWSETLTDHKAIADNLIKVLNEASLFSSILFKFYGADEINALYKESRNCQTGSIYFSSKTTFPQIPNVESSYIGLLPLKEFKKLIVDDDNIIRNVFEDNIRDFLDFSNPVNNKIDETLKGDNYFLFPLLNNGITIVANRIHQTGDQFTLFDYQIVNGCQTSSVLAKNLVDKLENLHIPIKIIVTNDEETKYNITLATNSQTPVKREQLASLSQFQRKLEDYYKAGSLVPKLFYERRYNQYNSDEQVPKARTISIQNQIKSFAAMFLRCPHRVTSYYGDLIKNIGVDGAEIFNPKHMVTTYYLAGHCLYRLETLFRNGTLDPQCKKIRFFILLGFLIGIIEEKFVTNDFVVEKTNRVKLKPLIDVLSDPDKTNNLFVKVATKIKSLPIELTKDSLRLNSTTEEVILCCKGILDSHV